MINIVGLGYGDIDDLTVGTLKVLKNSKRIFSNNIEHPVINYLLEEGIEFHPLKELSNNIVKYNESNDDIVYASAGNLDYDLKELSDFINLCKDNNIEYKIYTSAGIKESIQRCLNRVIGEVRVINSQLLDRSNIIRKDAAVITNIFNKSIVENVKLKLMKIYSEDISLYYVNIESKEFKEVKLKDIDKFECLNKSIVLYIPENSKGKKDISDLIEIVEVLRSENGCPWDKEQTHESIKKDIIEESYEVFDAIEQKNKYGLVEELGDVLFQIMFHTSLGTENNEFGILDVTDGICNKMIFRHPHVFGDVNVKDTAEVLVNWDELKKDEKSFESVTDELNGVAKALPALVRAKKVQKKAGKVGFDWDDVSGAIEKIKEELNEVIDVYKSEKMVRIKEEIGDLLFSCVNVSRFLKVDAEEALNLTTDKFINRFSYMEKKAKESNLNLDEMSLSDMDKLWDEAKKAENR